jgi:aspartate racemase
MHIGLIGGIGPAATEFYYRGLIDRYAGANKRLELTIVHADVHEMSRNLTNRDARKQAEIFAGLILRLKGAGAEAAAVTSMGGHFCIRELEPISPLPMLNGVSAVAAEINRRGYKTVGILGTRMVMETKLYGAIGSAAVVVPEGAALDEVHANYAAMATVGRVTDAQRRVFFAEGSKLCRERGADAVLLGGTDLFLAFQGQDCGFATLDSADIHVEAIYRKSIGAV